MHSCAALFFLPNYNGHMFLNLLSVTGVNISDLI